MNIKVTDYIAGVNEQLQPLMDYIREVIHEAQPEIEENMKWNAPSFEVNGKIICSLMAFKNHINLVFKNMDPDYAPYANMDVFGEKSRMKGYKQLKSKERLPEKEVLIKLIHDAIGLSQ